MLSNDTEKELTNYSMLAIFVFLLCFAFYIKTLAPTVAWGDAARAAIEAYLPIRKLSFPNPHLLFPLISKFFIKVIPFGDVAYKVNLESAFFGSLTISLLFLVIFKLTKSKISAFVGAISLAFSHTFWFLSVIGEYHTLCTLLLVLIILMLLKWRDNRNNLFLYLVSFIFSLTLSLNYFLILFLPAAFYFVFVNDPKKNIKTRDIYLMILLFFLGMVTFVFLHWYLLPIKDIKKIIGCFYAKESFSAWSLFPEIIKFIFYLLYQFPVFAFLIGLFGARKLFQKERTFFIFLFLIFIIDIIASSMFFRQRHFYLFIFSYLIFSIWVGFGFHFLIKKFAQKSLRRTYAITIILILITVTPLMIYYNIPKISKSIGIDLIKARSIPYRDNDRYFLLPDKSGYYGAYIYAYEAFLIAKPNACIIADYTPCTAMVYLKVIEHRRPDIEIVFIKPVSELSKIIREQINHRPIYLADDEPCYGIDTLRKTYKIVHRGPLYEIQNIK